MTVDYDNTRGILSVAFLLKDTVVGQVLARPEFYLLLMFHLFMVIACKSGYYDPERLHMELPMSLTGVTGSLMTFFVVFYNSHVFARYNRLYEITKNLNEYCLHTVSILSREIPCTNTRRKMARMLLASTFIFFFQRTPISQHEDAGTATEHNISLHEWTQLEKLGLLERHERELLQHHCQQTGSCAIPSFLLLQWSMRLYRTQNKARINDLETAYWNVRRCQDDVVEILELPMPWQYFHIMNVMLALNLTLWAYSFALMNSWLASIVFISIQFVFQGIRELSISLADPYGDDAADFPLNDWMNTLWVRVISVVEDPWTLEHSLPTEELPPLPTPAAGQHIVDVLADMDEEDAFAHFKRMEFNRKQIRQLKYSGQYTELPQDEDAENLHVNVHSKPMLLKKTHETDKATEDNHLDEEVDLDAELARLQDEIANFNQMEQTNQTKLEEVNALWSSRAAMLEMEIRTIVKKRDQFSEELVLLYTPPSTDPPPPGPRCLRFIESEIFHSLAAIVIVGNITTMVIKELEPAYKEDWYWLDQGFMVFYVVEITSKAIYLQIDLVVGKFGVVWWNYLDLCIVASGVFDQWLQPLLVSWGLLHDDNGNTNLLGFLRILRLTRVMKLFGMFLQADFAWTEEPPFQYFLMGVIGFNSLLMGLETDMPDFFLWIYIEQLLLVIFTFELAVRLRRYGCEFFCHPEDITWNLLDFSIVAGGIVDQWLMPAISLVQMMMGNESPSVGNLGQLMMMLRMARLLRILRLARLVKNIEPLYTLIIGIVKAMQGMGWVLILTGLVLYAFALLGVKLVGHGLLLAPDTPDEVREVFPSVLQSMFVLFKSMNGDWEALEPLFKELPLSKICFMIFTVISTWAILSILTAVVSDNMINATNEHRDTKEKEGAEDELRRSMASMLDVFQRVCEVDSVNLTEVDWNKALSEETTVFELENAAKMKKKDLVDCYQYLAKRDKNGVLSIGQIEFIEALQVESHPVSERSIMRLEKRLSNMEGHLTDLAEELRGLLPSTGEHP
eukprot:TRINITY_DN10193_c0_g1_i1.p1 TRINITY_DN10193_c0_g1~~TRINITY_DN10193_c0_g1_i1.p1  ORF type:complete len:1018 (-),score=200.57 TRINITY_DN10193_c0_g1_i1:485-3538(-)